MECEARHPHGAKRHPYLFACKSIPQNSHGIGITLFYLFVGEQITFLDQLKYQFVRQGSIKPNSNPVVLIHMISGEDMVARFGEIISLVFVKFEIDDVGFSVFINTKSGTWGGTD